MKNDSNQEWEAQGAVAWQCKEVGGTFWQDCSKERALVRAANPSKWEVRELYTHALPAPAVGVPDACVWTQDTDYETDVHYSACGEAWSFIEGGPKENKVRFCQGCGKPVVIAYQPKIGGV